MDFANVKTLYIGGREVETLYVAGKQAWRKTPPLPYDAEVEYLGCGGQQYVETGLQVINYVGYQLEMKYCFTEYNHTESWCVGYWNTQPEWRIYLVGHYFENLRCGVGPDNSQYHCSIPFDDNWHVAELKLDGAYLDGVRGADADLYAMPQPTTNSIWLGRSSHTDGNTPRRIAYCKMWTVDGQLVRDFIPVRVGQTGAWYDRANPTGGPNGNGLYYNNGTGYFQPGPDA